MSKIQDAIKADQEAANEKVSNVELIKAVEQEDELTPPIDPAEPIQPEEPIDPAE